MRGEWRIEKLGSVMTLQRGFDLPKSRRRTGRVPVISSSGPSGSHAEHKVAGPGVVTGRYGTIGEVFWVKDDFWPLNTALWVSDFHGNDPRYCSYLLRTVDFASCSDKGAVPGLNRNDLHELDVYYLPDVSTQQRIAAILGALDDKIDLNRRMNRTLEAMASALFKSWFVDFDPVVAKSEGRRPAGMSAELARVFPSRFVESELGPIPEGWKFVRLADCGRWVSGGTPSKQQPAYWGGEIPWLSAKSLGDAWVDSSEDRVSELGAANGTSLVPRDSVLFLVRGMSLAEEFRVSRAARDVTLNQDVKAIVADGRVPAALTFTFLRSSESDVLDLVDEASHGTKRLQTPLIEATGFTVPTPVVAVRLAEELDRLLLRVEAADRESRILAALRDTLLPKLLSGEVTLREAERAVGKVA